MQLRLDDAFRGHLRRLSRWGDNPDQFLGKLASQPFLRLSGNSSDDDLP